jgi:hypothetical protein
MNVLATIECLKTLCKIDKDYCELKLELEDGTIVDLSFDSYRIEGNTVVLCNEGS